MNQRRRQPRTADAASVPARETDPQREQDPFPDGLRKVIDKTRVAMLTTLMPDHRLRSRPLHTELIDEEGALWFIVAVDSPKVNEVAFNQGRVSLVYADVDGNNYVSITGRAETLHDSRRKAALWGTMAEAWFPNGVEDPAVALLKVTPESGEYWDRPGSAVGRLLAFARAAVAGDTSGLGQGRKFRMDETGA